MGVQEKTIKKAVSYCYETASFILEKCSTYTLISTSTPLGSSNFIKASTVFDDEL